MRLSIDEFVMQNHRSIDIVRSSALPASALHAAASMHSQFQARPGVALPIVPAMCRRRRMPRC